MSDFVDGGGCLVHCYIIIASLHFRPRVTATSALTTVQALAASTSRRPINVLHEEDVAVFNREKMEGVALKALAGGLVFTHCFD